MTIAEELASFVVRASYDDLPEETRSQIKIRVLDSVGCAIGALEGEPIKFLREQIADFGGEGHCTLIGGGRTSPDRAALYNCGLVRYLDFNDFYLAKGGVAIRATILDRYWRRVSTPERAVPT